MAGPVQKHEKRGKKVVKKAPIIVSEPVMMHKATDEQLASGVKLDTGKLSFHLISPDFMAALAFILTHGAEKYAERNWEKGMKWSRIFGAGMRHLWAWWGAKLLPGKHENILLTKHNFLLGDLDMESGVSHLWHAAFCVMVLVSYEFRGTGEDDRGGNLG